MAARIDQESNVNRLLATDEDKFRKKYKEIDDSTGLEVVFSSPSLYTLEKNRFFLMKESKKIILDSKFQFRPDYLSEKEYGTETLWYIILFVNDMSCIEQFNTYEVLVPSYSSILELAKCSVNNEFTLLTAHCITNQPRCLPSLKAGSMKNATGSFDGEKYSKSTKTSFCGFLLKFLERLVLANSSAKMFWR